MNLVMSNTNGSKKVSTQIHERMQFHCALAFAKLGQGKSERHKSIVVVSKA